MSKFRLIENGLGTYKIQTFGPINGIGGPYKEDWFDYGISFHRDMCNFTDLVEAKKELKRLLTYEENTKQEKRVVRVIDPDAEIIKFGPVDEEGKYPFSWDYVFTLEHEMVKYLHENKIPVKCVSCKHYETFPEINESTCGNTSNDVDSTCFGLMCPLYKNNVTKEETNV